ncbi:MAG: VapB-type antitoxin [Nitrososphaerales archaeon]
MVDKVSETIKVSKETKRSLVKVAARLQESVGKRVDFDEAIQHLMSLSEKRPDLLDKAFGSIPGLKVQDLHRERRADEQRAKRKYHI